MSNLGDRQARLSDVQQGVIGQNEFAKLAMMGSGGRIEIAAPLTDEERRDFEIHVHGQYGSAMALQIKCALELANLGGNARYLRIRFSVRDSRLVSDPIFWYYFAYLNPGSMRFEDPTFLIPSSEIHQHANPLKNGDLWNFTFEGSMEPESHDRWLPYRVSQFEIGKKLMSLATDLRKLGAASPDVSRLLEVPDLIWARRA